MEITNKNVRQLLSAVMEEDKSYKLTLIDNVMRAKRLLFGLGDNTHTQIIQDPTAAFDELYELCINDLEIMDGLLTIEINKLMKERISHV